MNCVAAYGNILTIWAPFPLYNAKNDSRFTISFKPDMTPVRARFIFNKRGKFLQSSEHYLCSLEDKEHIFYPQILTTLPVMFIVSLQQYFDSV